MIVINSGNDYVLYSMLKGSNVSLYIVCILFCERFIDIVKEQYLYLDLENKLMQTYIKTVNSLRTKYLLLLHSTCCYIWRFSTAWYGTVRFTFGGFSTGYSTWYLVLFLVPPRPWFQAIRTDK